MDFAWLSFCNRDVAHAFLRKNLISYPAESALKAQLAQY